MNFDEWSQKGHAKSSKIEAAGAKGELFYDFVKLWEAPVFSMFESGNSTATQKKL